MKGECATIFKWSIILTIASIIFPLGADTITLFNTGTQPVYAAVYYVGKDISLVGEKYILPPQMKESIIRPARKLGYDRQLVISRSLAEFLPFLSPAQYKALISINVGTLQGTYFEVNTKNNTIELTRRSHTVTSSLAHALEALKETTQGSITLTSLYLSDQARSARLAVNELLKQNLVTAQENVFKDKEAVVRVGNDLCMQEKNYLKARMPKVKKALEKMLGRSLSNTYIPKIALVGSGGGYRAMFTTLGFLTGAQEIGLLDATTYITALSGSTWCVGTWLALGLPIDEFAQDLRAIVAQNKGLASIGPNRAQLMGDVILTRYAYEQPISLVDFYGALLANALLGQFGDMRQQVRLSWQKERIDNGDFPLPIYTAISAEVGMKPYWYEFTPYEIGSMQLGVKEGIYIPTWSYGRTFVDGLSVDEAPELSFGFNLGTYGSAFAISFERLYKEVADSLVLPTSRMILKEILNTLGKQGRISAAKVANFSYGMSQSKRKDDKILALSDAGIDFNLPYPPISGERPERKVDIIIFLDASAGIKEAPELKAAEKYARDRNLKFPSIDYTMIDKKAMSVFKDPKDPDVPVVIYMPRIKDAQLWKEYRKKAPARDKYVQILEQFDPEVCAREEFCGTFNFAYSQDQSRAVIMGAHFNMLQSASVLRQTIEWVISNKKK